MNNCKNDELIGIALTSFNYGHYIGEAVQSVVNQTSPDWRLCIYDNGSTDNTLEVLAPYLKDERISLVIHDENIGARKNFEYTVHHANTMFFSTLQADDFLEDTFVEKALEQFKQHTDCPFVFFNWHQYMDDTKKRLFHNRFPFDKNRQGMIRISPYLSVCNFVPFHMVVFRTHMLQTEFEFLLRAPLQQVIEQYLLKLLEDKYGYGCYTGSLGGVWRRHAKQITVQHMGSGVADIEEPIERHWYATMAPHPNSTSVFLALVIFVRFCSHVDYFKAVRWLLAEGSNYTESFNISLTEQQRKQFQKLALTVAVKYTTYSMMNLCSADQVKEWLQFSGYASTKHGLKRALEDTRQSEGDVFINQDEINTVCNRFFPLDDRAKAYHEWRNARVFTEIDEQIFAQRLQASVDTPNFLLVTLLESNNISQLADLIDSLNQQLYTQWSLAVIATTPSADSLFDEIENLHWIEAEQDVFTTL